MSLDNLRHKAERCTTHHYCDCAWYKINKLGVELANAEAKLSAAEKVVEAARKVRDSIRWNDICGESVPDPRTTPDLPELFQAVDAYDKSQAKGGDG